MPKKRRYFDLYTQNPKTKNEVWMGKGWVYEEGNCQVVICGALSSTIDGSADEETHKKSEADYSKYHGPWQFSNLADVLRIKGVHSFEWNGDYTED